MFKCPKCGERTVTYATNRTTGEFVYGRYRRCPTCGTKFATIERLEGEEKKAFTEGYKTALKRLGEIADKMSKIGAKR